MMADQPPHMTVGKLILYDLALAPDDSNVHLVPPGGQIALCGKTGLWRIVSDPHAGVADCPHCLEQRHER
jgi:hypothetical protein